MMRNSTLFKGAAIKMAGLVLLTLLLSPGANAQVVTLLDAGTHPKFVNPLPIPTQIDATSGGIFNMQMNETTQWLGLVDPITQLPLNTTVWGYGFAGQAVTYPGPTFIAKKDQAVNVRWDNNLPRRHLLPVDPTLHMAGPHGATPAEMAAYYAAGNIPTVVHLHGGNTESASDGIPEAWYTQNYVDVGAQFVKQTLTYHNTQEAATLWYHDHALGITRLNVYAGLAGFYILEDKYERQLAAKGTLPKGPQDIEIVIQDRMFTSDGQLFLPSKSGDPWFGDPDEPLVLPYDPSVVAEFFGDFIVVNGMAWPKLEVEPRQYRFRLLNGSDSRFYALELDNGESFLQIATDDGLLPNVVSVPMLVLAPGERAEVVVDFSNYNGQNITVKNYGPDEPFQGSNFVLPGTRPTGEIMQFQVTKRLKDTKGKPATMLAAGDYLRPALENLGTPTATRRLALFEGEDADGRLQPLLGVINGDNPKDATNVNGSLAWFEPITENPGLNSVEVWEVYNATPDAHPIHLHLVSFQILGRAPYTSVVNPQDQIQHDGNVGTGGYLVEGSILEGALVAPPPNEKGWKDTFIVPPGTVGKVIARFNRPGRYVWHCHILSHEDHEMMRPFYVGPMPAAAAGATKGAAVGDIQADQVDPALDQGKEFSIYPNPVKERFTLEFALAGDSEVGLRLYNLDGRLVKSEDLGFRNEGFHSLSVTTDDLENGMYILELNTGSKKFRESIFITK